MIRGSSFKLLFFLANSLLLSSCNPVELGRQVPNLLGGDMEKISEEACAVAGLGVVGAVRSGIALYRANDLVENGLPGRDPPTLDSAADGPAGTGNLLFANVLQGGIRDPHWSKKQYVYTHTCEKVSSSFTYHPETGKFE